VIEDNTVCSFICSELSVQYRVEAQHGGGTGKTEFPPDLIICDVMMAEMDGFSFYKTLVSDPKLNMIPVIFLTAKTGIEEKLTGLALGAIDYLYKPFHTLELLFKINALLKNQKLKQALYEKDKYASIGMLFGGILHEIMNPEYDPRADGKPGTEPRPHVVVDNPRLADISAVTAA
jgi:DNA-binding response OmpR family regulator